MIKNCTSFKNTKMVIKDFSSIWENTSKALKKAIHFDHSRMANKKDSDIFVFLRARTRTSTSV